MNFFAPISEKEALLLPALSLAYVGDAVHSMYVREQLVLGVQLKTDALHTLASAEVKASAQAHLVENLEDRLTENEKSVYLRGRNAKTHHKAKNQNIVDYRKATGFEAVLGYLYLTGQHQRIVELLTNNED